ncbi:hypothetical protein HNY73_014822 [Argiope bruennichi]|uniref:Uncharacterized protein n=1 Tax=Argiope bruennichi TaxID=94029 RepID=A0A8T0EUQ5_ARGBR|nr:hypothetical protein HNY73_014822 [Argiope bruennichi]
MSIHILASSLAGKECPEYIFLRSTLAGKEFPEYTFLRSSLAGKECPEYIFLRPLWLAKSVQNTYSCVLFGWQRVSRIHILAFLFGWQRVSELQLFLRPIAGTECQITYSSVPLGLAKSCPEYISWSSLDGKESPGNTYSCVLFGWQRVVQNTYYLRSSWLQRVVQNTYSGVLFGGKECPEYIILGLWLAKMCSRDTYVAFRFWMAKSVSRIHIPCVLFGCKECPRIHILDSLLGWARVSRYRF